MSENDHKSRLLIELRMPPGELSVTNLKQFGQSFRVASLMAARTIDQVCPHLQTVIF